MSVAGVICTLLLIYLILFVIRVVLSYFPIDPDGGVAAFAGFLFVITDPVLRPLRRAIPPLRVGAVAIDLSTVVVIFGISILRGVIC